MLIHSAFSFNCFLFNVEFYCFVNLTVFAIKTENKN